MEFPFDIKHSEDKPRRSILKTGIPQNADDDHLDDEPAHSLASKAKRILAAPYGRKLYLNMKMRHINPKGLSHVTKLKRPRIWEPEKLGEQLEKLRSRIKRQKRKREKWDMLEMQQELLEMKREMLEMQERIEMDQEIQREMLEMEREMFGMQEKQRKRLRKKKEKKEKPTARTSKDEPHALEWDLSEPDMTEDQDYKTGKTAYGDAKEAYRDTKPVDKKATCPTCDCAPTIGPLVHAERYRSGCAGNDQGSGPCEGEDDGSGLACSVSDATSFHSTTVLNQQQAFKQIGSASVHVSMVISSAVTAPKDTEYVSEGATDDAEGEQDHHEVGHRYTAGGSRSQVKPGGIQQGESEQRHSSHVGEKTGTGGSGGGGKRDNSGDHDDKEGQKRRKKGKTASTQVKRPRLACPYQAFQPGVLSCFERKSRNPHGGCEDLYRLKQHLSRRHMRSRRCGRCWTSFESKERAKQHEDAATCNDKPLPEFERLMEVEKEPLVQRSQTAMTEEDSWWAIFQLLISGMNLRDIDELKLEYSPYYVHRDRTVMIPAMNFSESLFEPLTVSPTAFPSDVFGNATGPSFTSEESPHPNFSSNFLSREFSVPVFQAQNPSSLGSIPEVTMSGTGSESAPFTALSDQSWAQTQGGTSVSEKTSVTSGSFLPQIKGCTCGGASNSASQTKIERSHMRLKAQHRQIEKENIELRGAKVANRMDLSKMEAVLDEVLGSEELSQGLFENLSQVSDILLEMKSSVIKTFSPTPTAWEPPSRPILGGFSYQLWVARVSLTVQLNGTGSAEHVTSTPSVVVVRINQSAGIRGVPPPS